ncbi:MAG: serine acetyltransferase [Epsilonproteobacteria bacterium]|nr:serine acetyltransferase [Campylobacterota bacterium]
MSKIPYWIYFLSNFLYKLKVPVVPMIFVWINRILWGAYIPASCIIGKGTRFGYGGSSVVIHARAIIGKNCNIGPCVTIGGRSKIHEVPKIGNRVYIGSGARVLGNVVIGDDVVIGANAVVIKDVPSGCIVVGIPAKIIKQGIRMEDYV